MNLPGEFHEKFWIQLAKKTLVSIWLCNLLRIMSSYPGFYAALSFQAICKVSTQSKSYSTQADQLRALW